MWDAELGQCVFNVECAGDINLDGAITANDILLMLANFGTWCPGYGPDAGDLRFFPRIGEPASAVPPFFCRPAYSAAVCTTTTLPASAQKAPRRAPCALPEDV